MYTDTIVFVTIGVVSAGKVCRRVPKVQLAVDSAKPLDKVKTSDVDSNSEDHAGSICAVNVLHRLCQPWELTGFCDAIAAPD